MRLAAGVIAVVALTTVAIRIYLNMDANDIGLGQAVWNIYRFFTIWTVTLTGVLCGWIALGGRPPQWMGVCLALAIIVVAGVYHSLLAHLNDYVGIDFVLDHLLHTIIPIAFVLLWLVALPKGVLRWGDMIYSMAYPFIYCVYALGRGAVDGVYPYGFLNVTELGSSGVALNVAGLVVVFAVGGLILIGIGRLSARR